jgi:cytochrome P450
MKSDFYNGGNFADEAHSIVSERDPDNHRQMWKFLSRAFSDTSLKEQEDLVGKTIDRFVEILGKESVVDLTHWFNLLTFGSSFDTKWPALGSQFDRLLAHLS